MQKLILVLFALSIIMGCGHSASQSEYSKQQPMWKNWDHFKFSVWGYKNPTPEDEKKSKEQGWWGKEVTSESAK